MKCNERDENSSKSIIERIMMISQYAILIENLLFV
jgi:hypothetical protein